MVLKYIVLNINIVLTIVRIKKNIHNNKDSNRVNSKLHLILYEHDNFEWLHIDVKYNINKR